MRLFLLGLYFKKKKMRAIRELPQFDLSGTQKKVEIVVFFFTIFSFWC